MPGEKDSVKHFTFIILNPAGPVLQRVAYTVFNSSKPASFSKPSATLLPSLNQNSLDEALLLTPGPEHHCPCSWQSTHTAAYETVGRTLS